MKSKILLPILGLTLLVALACSESPKPPATAENTYEALVLALDRLAGPGQWSARSHQASGDTLTVNGLTVNLPPAPGDPADARPGVLSLESVSIKNGLDKNSLEKVLAPGNRQNQPETALAEQIRMTGLRILAALEEGEGEATAGEMDWGQVKLAANAAEGPAGFLKALRLGTFGYKDLRLTLKSREAEAVSTVAELEAQGLAFSQEMPSGLETLDPSGFLAQFWGFSAKSLKAAGLSLDFSGRAQEAPVKGTLAIASMEETDLKAPGTLGLLRLNDLKGSFTDAEGLVHTVALADLSLSGLEAGDYLAWLLPGLIALAQQEEDIQVEELLTAYQTLASFFISPFSLGDLSLTGLETDLNGLFKLKVAEYRLTGPFKAGEVPPAQKSVLKGLEISLPEAESASEKLADFVRALGGLNRLALEAESEGTYDPRSGVYNVTVTSLKATDLFDFSGELTWGGLTGARLEKLKTVPLSEPVIALFNPEEILGDASLNSFTLKYTDRGLADIIFSYQAATSEPETTAEALKQNLANELAFMLQIGGPMYLKNVDDLSRPLLGFLKAPRDLEISLKAEPPLSYTSSINKLGGDPQAVLDSLNLTISANGQPGSPLRFTDLDSGGPRPDPGLESPGQYAD